MAAHGRVPNYSFKAVLLASSCVFGLDLVILICYDMYVCDPLNFFFGTCGCGDSERWSRAFYQFGYPAVSGCHLSSKSLRSNRAGCLASRDNIPLRVMKPLVKCSSISPEFIERPVLRATTL
jgi:hypothetical protein